MQESEIQVLIDSCMKELSDAHQGKYHSERADKTAALFLEVQIKLSDFLSDAEFKYRMAKQEVERISAEKYFALKSSEKKMTEAALDHAVARDEDVYRVKEEQIRLEANHKKWQYVMNVLNNSHIYFRTLSKNNQ